VGFLRSTSEITSAVAAKRTLNQAADAALLAGTRAAASAYEDGREDWASEGARIAESFWANALSSKPGADVRSSSFQFAIDGKTVNGTAQYSGRHSSVFRGLVPGPVGISETMSTSMNLKTYIDLTFLVDVSPSMGIGATTNDQTLMADNNNCAFACHIPKNEGQRNQTPEAARAVGATLRMDVVRQAMIDSLDLLRGRVEDDEVQVSVYSFDTTFQEIIAPTTDLDAAQQDLAALDMVEYSVTGPQKFGSTIVGNALEDLHDTLSARGNFGTGFGPDQRLSHVILASDGVEHSVWQELTGTFGDGSNKFSNGTGYPDGWTTRPDAYHDGGTRYIQPFDPSPCTPIKSDGHTIYGAQIQYITSEEMRTSTALTNKLDYIDDSAAEIEYSFSSCASNPALHVSATTPEEISSLFNEIVQSVLSAKLRLIN